MVRWREEVGCEVEWWGGVGRGGDEVGEWVGESESGWVGGRGEETQHITHHTLINHSANAMCL